LIRSSYGKTLASLSILILILAFSGAAPAMQSRAYSSVRVTTFDESGKPVAGVTVELKQKGKAVSAATSDDKGKAEFLNIQPGAYEVVVSREAFETLTQSDIAVAASSSVEVEFAMVPRIEIKSTVDVNASAEAQPIEKGASPSTELQRATVKDLPNKPATVTDTLPLIPGVVRSAEGQIKISGSGEHRSALIVNSADVTDPATGQFGVTVPVDSVETINVFKTPYLAQYGRFTAGVVSVETRRGGDKWSFEVNDPLPEFRIRSGHLRGLKEASPRVVFNGPIIPNRFYISEGLEYELIKRPVRTLPFPFDETKQESVNSFTQLDYIVSPLHTLTGTFHAAPRHMNFVGLDFFNPQPVTPTLGARDYTGTIIDRLTIGESLLESIVAVKRFRGNVWGQGSGEMTLAPAGNSGNYFSRQDRRASRVEWIETFSLSPIKNVGAHNLKFGTSLARTNNSGEFLARAVNIEDAKGNLIKRIEFAGGGPFNLSDFEAGFFAQDHWVITQRLAMDFGARFERQGITETFRIAPRVGVAWTPLGGQQTVIRGGFGIFYDRVPLNVYAFDRYPEAVITSYGADGSIIGGPRRFHNVTDRAERVNFPFIGGSDGAGNFAPYSETWNVEVEHPVTRHLRVRANYLQSNSNGLIILTPGSFQGGDAYVLGGNGRSRYRQLELTARVAWHEGQQLFFSYVRSRTRGDINEFNNYLGNFPFPVLRQNEYTNLTADLPHRFLAWGMVRLPWRMRISPIVEYRNGFPYATLNAMQDYVGIPNRERFPNFFSFDSRVSKEIKINDKYSVRFSVSGFNVTNHFNPYSVRANIDDPQFGVFFGNYKRRFRLDFDVLF
jgi:hypothetical protein